MEMAPEGMKLKVGFVYAHHNEGCAPTYTLAAFKRLGHEVWNMSPNAYFAALPEKFDLFFCQDSGEGIDFRNVSTALLRKTSWWSWDSRFNRLQRNPGDDDMAELVAKGGGWVFQAQTPDLERLARERRLERQSWLPIAADPQLWRDEPPEEKLYTMSFIGNCYDGGRAAALNYARDRCELFWPGPNAVFGEAAAKIYRQSWVVFHAPTFYNLPHDVTGERVDYDLTMRPYEAMACGVPLVTPPLPDYGAVGFREGTHIFLYNSLEEIPSAFSRAQEWARNPACRLQCRLLAEHNSYEHRVLAALATLRRAGVLHA